MLRGSRSVRVLLLSAFLLASCGGNDDSDKADAPKVGKIEDHSMVRTLKVEVTGASRVSFTKDVEMRFVLREGTGEGAAHSVASVTLPKHLDVGDGLSILTEVALVGIYKGDGTYTIEAGSGQAPTTGPTAPPAAGGGTTRSLSTANLSIANLQPPIKETRFGYLLEPCKVRFSKRLTEGSADCPALVAVNGDRIAMHLSWKG